MTFPSTLVTLFIFILAGILVLRPFLVQDSRKKTGLGIYDSLLAEKERLYASIEDLDLDLELDKISPEVHAQSREDLLVEAARVLKELDDYQRKTGKKRSKPEVVTDDQKLDRMIAERRKELLAAQADQCPNCGKPVLEGDQFCSHCGDRL